MKNHKKAIFRILIQAGMIIALLASSNSITPGYAMEQKDPEAFTPILLGFYPETSWVDATSVADEMIAMDTWTGKHTTFGAMNSDLTGNQQWIGSQLNALWNAPNGVGGYTPYINLYVNNGSPTAAQIANGSIDASIDSWATYYAAWATGGKYAFLAILPEMNAQWMSYSGDPENYKLAYRHVKDRLAAKGVTSANARFVFSANAWYQLPFEPYYPGDSYVDVVGFNAFNFGYCQTWPDPYWMPGKDVLGFAINEMRSLAPSKGIFVTDLGSTAKIEDGTFNNSRKNQWLQDTYAFLKGQPAVRAVFYDNSSSGCDWKVWRKSPSLTFDGYKTGVSSVEYGYQSPAALKAMSWTVNIVPTGTYKRYLPQIQQKQQTGGVVLGTYSQDYQGIQSTMQYEYNDLSNWAGKKLSLAGIFMDFSQNTTIEAANSNVELTLETAFDNGYTPFVNFHTPIGSGGWTAAQIANGAVDSQIHLSARAIKRVITGQRIVFIAPLQEMNGSWVIYGLDPASFISAYKRIQNIFAEEQVPAANIRWVFAPDGFDPNGKPNFEQYYPGDAFVDVVAFSSYNYGYCPALGINTWKTPGNAFNKPIARMMAMAPTKPIFVAQTATTAYHSSGNKDDAAKDKWLTDALTLVTTFPSVKALLYFNYWKDNCDYSFFSPGVRYSGWITGIASPNIGYVTPDQMTNLFPKH